jgi:Methyltransferase domain
MTGPGARVVEIGCGTGQTIVPPAERGYRITRVELGERLAAMAREKLARCRAVLPDDPAIPRPAVRTHPCTHRGPRLRTRPEGVSEMLTVAARV